MQKYKLLTYSKIENNCCLMYLMCHEFIPAYFDFNKDDESFENIEDIKKLVINNNEYLEKINGKFCSCGKPNYYSDWINYAIWKLCGIADMSDNVAIVYDQKSRDLITLKF